MHPFFLWIGEHREGIVPVDAIRKRESEKDDRLLYDRCANLFSDRERAVVALTADGLVEWHVQSFAALLHIYQHVEVTTVLAVPHATLLKLVPEK